MPDPSSTLPAGSVPGSTQPHLVRTLADGRYALVALHALGGIGRVWVARDNRVGRNVALKDLRPDRLGQPGITVRFLEEARITGQLEHPGIVPVYEVVDPSGTQPAFYTMRLIKGRTLSDAALALHAKPRHDPARRLEFLELVRAFVTVCQTMVYAHSRGVLHRDLKGKNVQLGDYGEVLVLDWGLAKLIDKPADEPGGTSIALDPEQLHDETQAGAVLGTPACMAPEQAEGRIDQLDVRTDVYALGVILYEILTGKLPFAGKPGEIIQKVKTEEPARPRKVNPRAPEALEAICQKAMAKRPGERYPTARELVRDVERWLADEPVSAHREGWATKLIREARRHKTITAGVLAAALTAVVLLTYGLTTAWVARARRAEELRGQVQARIEAGLASTRGGDVEQGSLAFAEAVTLSEAIPSLRGLHDEAAQYQERLETYRKFQKAAADVIEASTRETMLLADPSDLEKPDPVIEQYESALAIYRVVEDPDWQKGTEGKPLSAEQVAGLRKDLGELALQLAIRRVLSNRKGSTDADVLRSTLVLLDRAASIQGPSHGIWTLRTLAYSRLKDRDAFDRANAEVQRTPPKTAEDFYVKGRVDHGMFDDPAEAERSLEQCLRQKPDHFGALLALALLHLGEKQYERMLAPATACVALRPDDPLLLWLRGMAYFSLKDHRRAYGDFDRMVQLDPRSREGWFYRGRMAIAINERWKDAEADFTKSLELDPGYRHARAWRGVARAKIGRLKDAIGDAEEAVRDKPSAEICYYAARTYALASGLARAAAQKSQLADRSVELIKQALRLGLNDLDRLGPGSDFDPVRGHPDFPKLPGK